MSSRIAVLLSGRGSNFVAIADACDRGEIPADVVLVVSNRPSAPGLERAKERGISTAVISGKGLSRGEHEARVIAAIEGSGADWVCLAGYMRLLSPDFVGRFPNRIVNIHPALLPSFPGLDGQRQALEYGVKVTGCTVHLVDAGCDTGPVVVQRTVRVFESDSPESLSGRILEQEHIAYPEALRKLLTSSWRLEGRRVVFA